MASHSSIPAWRILLGSGDWQEPGWLQSMGPPRVRHDQATELAHVMNLCFQSSLCFTAKFSWRYRNFLYTSCLHTCITSRVINIPHHSGSLVTTEHLGMHHGHPKSQLALGLTPGAVHSAALEKCAMTCIHHYGIAETAFTALKTLCALFIHPFLPSPRQPLIFSLSP